MKQEFIQKTESFLEKVKRVKTSYDCLKYCYIALIKNDYFIEDLKSEISEFEKEYKEALADSYLKLTSTVLAFKDKLANESTDYYNFLKTNFKTTSLNDVLEGVRNLELTNEEKLHLIDLITEITEFKNNEEISKNCQKISIHLSKMSGKNMLFLKSIFYDSEYGWILDLNDDVNCLEIESLNDVTSVTDISNLENLLSSFEDEIKKIKESIPNTTSFNEAIEKSKNVIVISSKLGFTICTEILPEDELTFGLTNFEYEVNEYFFNTYYEIFGNFRLAQSKHSLFWDDHEVFKEIYLNDFIKVAEFPKDIIKNPLVSKITYFKK